MSAEMAKGYGGLFEAKREIALAYDSGDLERLLRTCDSVVPGLPEYSGDWAEQVLDYNREIDAEKLHEYAHKVIVGALLNFDVDRYSFLIQSAGSSLWGKVSSSNFSLSTDTVSNPRKGKDRYDDLKPVLERFMDSESYASTAVELLSKALSEVSFELPVLPKSLVAYDKNHERLLGLGHDIEDHSAFVKAAMFALDRIDPDEPAVHHACRTLRHVYPGGLEAMLGANARRCAAALYDPARDPLVELRRIAVYADIMGKHFSTKSPRHDAELPDDVKGRVLEFAREVYPSDLPARLHKAVGAAAVRFRDGYKFLNNSIADDIPDADLPSFCQKLNAYAAECPKVLPYNVLPVLFERSFEYLESLLSSEGFNSTDFTRVYDCLRNLVINRHLKTGRKEAMAALAGFHDPVVECTKRDMYDVLDVVVGKANAPRLFSVSDLWDKRAIRRAAAIHAERFSIGPSDERIKEAAFSAHELNKLLYFAVNRYAFTHMNTADPAQDIVDAAYCRPVLEDVRSAAEAALDFIAGVSDKYACANGTVLKRRASFDDKETGEAFFGLYNLVHYLGGLCEPAVEKYNEWAESAGQVIFDPYIAGFADMKIPVPDSCRELADRRPYAVISIPDKYFIHNSLAFPSRFLGGERR